MIAALRSIVPVVGFALLQTTFGLVLMSWFDPARRFSPALRFVGAVVVGWVVSGFLVLLLAMGLRSLPAGLLAATLMMAGGLAGFCRTRRRKLRWPTRTAALRAAVKSLWTWLAVIMLGAAVLLEIQVLVPEPPFAAGILVGWGDVALHLGMIERLSVASPFVLEHPAYAGHALSYPFFINFVSAIYRRLGLPALAAYHLPALVFLSSAILLLLEFYRRLVRRRGLALCLVMLALFGGGLGWWWLGADVSAAYRSGGLPAVIATTQNFPHEYTHLDLRTGGVPTERQANHNIVWIVPVLSFLTHQRSFPVGLSLGLLVIFGALYYGGQFSFARYGLLAGLLPLAHGHSLLALAILGVGLLISQPRRCWTSAAFGAVTLLAAAPSLWYLRGAISGVSGKPLVTWWWGWMTCTHQHHWFACDPDVAGTDASAAWFWLKNFGGVVVAWALVALYRLVARLMRGRWVGRAHPATSAHHSLPLLVPSVLLFVIPNLVRLQPWEFDNNKVLFWWWIVAIGVVGQAMAALRSRWRPAMMFAFALAVLPAGVADVSSRLFHFHDHHYGYVGESELTAAAWIRANLPANAAMIGSTSPNHFVPILAGRAVALGFEGWLWTEGVDYAKRRRAIEAFARGDVHQVCAERFAYVVDDPGFRATFTVDQAAFSQVVTPLWQQTTPSGIRVIGRIKCPSSRQNSKPPVPPPTYGGKNGVLQ